jgi:hypothetical protein
MAEQTIKNPDHTIAIDPRATWQRFEGLVRKAVTTKPSVAKEASEHKVKHHRKQ